CLHLFYSNYFLLLFHSLSTLQPRPTLFPYTTLFRSAVEGSGDDRVLPGLEAPGAGEPHRSAALQLQRRRRIILHLPGLKALPARSEEHTSELQSHLNLVCRLLLEKKKHIMCKQ